MNTCHLNEYTVYMTIGETSISVRNVYLSGQDYGHAFNTSVDSSSIFVMFVKSAVALYVVLAGYLENFDDTEINLFAYIVNKHKEMFAFLRIC